MEVHQRKFLLNPFPEFFSLLGSVNIEPIELFHLSIGGGYEEGGGVLLGGPQTLCQIKGTVRARENRGLGGAKGERRQNKDCSRCDLKANLFINNCHLFFIFMFNFF